ASQANGNARRSPGAGRRNVMTFGRLLRHNLFFHWRGNLAVLLGVAVGAAVLTGALLVGDSLRGSLRDLTLQRLDWVDYSLVGGRFFRQELALELGVQRISPAILLQGAATNTGATGTSATGALPVRRAGRVSILGVDERFWSAGSGSSTSAPNAAPGGKGLWESDKTEVVLNTSLAADLDLKAGDPVVLFLQKVSTVPRETLLGRRESSDVLDELKLTVRAVIPDNDLGGFSLNPVA